MRGGQHVMCGCGQRRNKQPRSLTFTALRAANLERLLTAWHPLMARTPAEYAGELLGVAGLILDAIERERNGGAAC